MIHTVLGCLLGLGLGAGAPNLQAEIDRLVGHSVRVDDGSYEIVDIAGEGKPLVGCIEKTERGLFLQTESERLALEGPLAVPGNQRGGPGQLAIIDILLHPGFYACQTRRAQAQFLRIGMNFHAKCSRAQ